MKRNILLGVLLFFSVHSFSQGKYGFEAGAGYTPFKKSYITPTIKGYYLARLSHTFYGGGELSFQRFSLLDNLNPPASGLAFGDVVRIRQTSSYLFFTPKIEMGIGFRKHVFANFLMGPGIYLGGSQWTHQYEPFWTTASGSYGADTSTANTTYNIPNIIFRIGGGFTERIPTFRYWNIVISEEFSYMPGNLSKQSPGFKTNYFSLTVGLMHKYPQVAMEED